METTPDLKYYVLDTVNNIVLGKRKTLAAAQQVRDSHTAAVAARQGSCSSSRYKILISGQDNYI